MYIQQDLYGSPLFVADSDGWIEHCADHDIWGMSKNTRHRPCKEKAEWLCILW